MHNARRIKFLFFTFFINECGSYKVEWMRARGGAYRTCLCWHEISFCVRLRTHQCCTQALSNTIEKLYSSRRVERKVCAWRCCVCHCSKFRVFVCTIGWMHDTNTRTRLRPRFHTAVCEWPKAVPWKMDKTNTHTNWDGWMVGYMLQPPSIICFVVNNLSLPIRISTFFDFPLIFSVWPL